MTALPTIREAAPGDLQALRRLWMQADALHARLQPRFFRAPEGGDVRPPGWLVGALREPDGAVLVAERDGTVAGMVHVQVFDTPPDPWKVRLVRGHVEDLVVDRGARGHGVGRALMDAAAEWCRRRGAAQLLLTVWAGNRAAHAFYDALGYREVSRVLGIDLEPEG